MHESLSGTLLPVHLQPKADELLSSWLVRLAIAHDKKPDTFYSLISPQRPKFPLYIDETTDDHILCRIELATGVSTERVKSTTLTPYRDSLPKYHHLGPSGPRSMSHQWVMPISHR